MPVEKNEYFVIDDEEEECCVGLGLVLAHCCILAVSLLSAPYFLPGKNPVCLKLLDKISIIFLVIFLDVFGNS
jgi:hypothetical protein